MVPLVAKLVVGEREVEEFLADWEEDIQLDGEPVGWGPGEASTTAPAG